MALKNDRYTYRVTWSEDDSEYVGLCAEFPSLSWLAKTPGVALKGIRKLVEDVVKDMQEEGEPYCCIKFVTWIYPVRTIAPMLCNEVRF